MSGIGLISDFIGEKPDTTVSCRTLIGNGRPAIDSAAAARTAAGNASRNSSAVARSDSFEGFPVVRFNIYITSRRDRPLADQDGGKRSVRIWCGAAMAVGASIPGSLRK